MSPQGASLQETFETLHAVLRGAAPPESAERALGLDARRVAFYADTVYEHVHDILRKNFTALAEVLGEATFASLVRQYYALHPAQAFELNEDAAPFREFLASRASRGEGALGEVHLELAELEWQEFVAYVHPAQIPARRWLSRPTINPTLAILQLDYPVADFLDAWRQRGENGDAPELPSAPRPETVFVLRHPESENAIFVAASDALLFAFKVVHDGAEPSQAARAAGVPEALVHEVLREASDWGIVLLPEPSGRVKDLARSTDGGEPPLGQKESDMERESAWMDSTSEDTGDRS